MAFANVNNINPGWKLGPLTFYAYRFGRWDDEVKALILLPSFTVHSARYRGDRWIWLWVCFWRGQYAVCFDLQKLKRILPGQSTGKNDNQKPL